MTTTVIGRAFTTTTAIAFTLCAATVGPGAGIGWWATTYLIIYPFIHLFYRHRR